MIATCVAVEWSGEYSHCGSMPATVAVWAAGSATNSIALEDRYQVIWAGALYSPTMCFSQDDGGRVGTTNDSAGEIRVGGWRVGVEAKVEGAGAGSQLGHARQSRSGWGAVEGRRAEAGGGPSVGLVRASETSQVAHLKRGNTPETVGYTLLLFFLACGLGADDDALLRQFCSTLRAGTLLLGAVQFGARPAAGPLEGRDGCLLS